jgi:hypothetical protein
MGGRLMSDSTKRITEALAGKKPALTVEKAEGAAFPALSCNKKTEEEMQHILRCAIRKEDFDLTIPS